MFTFMTPDLRLETPINWATKSSPVGMRTISYSDTLDRFVVAGGTSIYSSDDDGTTWTLRSSSGNDLRDSLWCPELELFVVVGGNASAEIGKVMTSPDGITWTTQTIPSTFTGGKAISWSSSLNLFVAGCVPMSDNYPIITSPDGITWTTQTTPNTSNKVNGVAWSPSLGRFVCSGTGLTSTNGTTWTGVSFPQPSTSISWLEYHDLFISFTNNGPTYATSTNGTVWTARTLPISETQTWVGFVENEVDGIVLAYATSSSSPRKYGYSSNAVSWNQATVAYSIFDSIYVSGKATYFAITQDMLLYGQHYTSY